MAESLTEESIRRQLVEEYLRDAGIRGEKRIARMMEYFLGFEHEKYGAENDGGRQEVGDLRLRQEESHRLSGGGLSLCDRPHAQPVFHPGSLCLHRRRRVPPPDVQPAPATGRPCSASISSATIPNYKSVPKVYYDRQMRPSTLEGGDILVLSRGTVAVGISQRTQPWMPSSSWRRMCARANWTFR